MAQLPIYSLVMNISLFLEAFGALLMIPYMLKALLHLLQFKPLSNHSAITQARLLVAQGAITGLSYKLAATLFGIVFNLTWLQVARAFVIFALRTLLSRFFHWEQSRLNRYARGLF